MIIQYLSAEGCREEIEEIAEGHLEGGASSEALFDEAYGVADKFMFSPEYLEWRDVKWLGKTRVEKVPMRAGVGPITINHVLVSDAYHGLLALHQHVAIGNEVTLDGGASGTADAVRTLHELYWLRNLRGESSEWARAIDPFWDMAEHDRHGLFSRRAIYVSVLLANEQSDLISDWKSIAAPLYGLLKLHAEGVDPDNAEKSLKDRMFKSARFFVDFIDADAAVSLAVPYPSATDAGEWPSVLPTSEEQAREVLDCWQERRRRADLSERFEAYDLSPEYPALRYNAMALLEVVGSAAYAESYIRDQLEGMMARRWPLGLFSAVRSSTKIDRTYFQARSLAILRLAVLRETASDIIGTQIMEESERAIDGMRASLTNGLLAFLTASAVVLALVQIVVAVTGSL